MSEGALHQSKAARRACQSCRARKARFAHQGSVTADRDHTLCFECYRAERERRRAQHLAAAATRRLPFDDEGPVLDGRPEEPPASRKRFTSRQVAHRRRMLEHLQSIRRAAGAEGRNSAVLL